MDTRVVIRRLLPPLALLLAPTLACAQAPQASPAQINEAVMRQALIEAVANREVRLQRLEHDLAAAQAELAKLKAAAPDAKPADQPKP